MKLKDLKLGMRVKFSCYGTQYRARVSEVVLDDPNPRIGVLAGFKSDDWIGCYPNSDCGHSGYFSNPTQIVQLPE